VEFAEEVVGWSSGRLVVRCLVVWCLALTR